MIAKGLGLTAVPLAAAALAVMGLLLCLFTFSRARTIGNKMA
ncbi:hypothetical protein YPD27_0881 [Yersinia pestis KIM D27]|nr:hypothetical protein YPD27_0881 [Yersinia pestis KIM D27]